MSLTVNLHNYEYIFFATEVLNMFFKSNLCTPERLIFICEKFSKRLVKQSVNSASAFNLLWKFVQEWHNFLQYDELIQYIYENLGSSEMTRGADNETFYINNTELHYPLLQNHIEIASFDLLIAKFIYYYMTRLPILMRNTSYNGKTFSKEERQKITKSCMDEVCNSWFYKNKSIVFSKGLTYDMNRDYWNADSIKKQSEKDAYIKDYNWIFSGKTEESDYLPDRTELTKNQYYFLEKILDDYFIIFYKSLQSYLVHITFAPWSIAQIDTYLDDDFLMNG